ncbi:MAG: glycerol-3-phosphate 1-O-acyltransferase PlsY [Loktanella sp.]|jgi:acyl phosphate:glycerol-3-phosphate acyltransferase|nr:glycerol-3-phosphate 1-O-acyltransferase PlsY [Loktanella sp.]MDO7607829.1 glycerol-3-phosphate 1-O-acyltransferase PlsY [Loktanella sp.]MDO7622756.1 glycerol-3-phosphate 1-O-acyltransferase PlsY [Loktanella sp.]MDO7626343.1 glycerol-3-phosphate 1-O-acyltransferase PlsY [Loktanella sp.]MDO7664628.1 glycerol-3-phosphate 1-O-acyltransferase PlsY [Loktanella sp.]
MQLIQTSTAVLLVWAIAGYLLGSIPFGMVVARFMGLGNLREIGSGNIGATNVLRTGNKKAAALTLLFDAGKGAVIVLLARKFATEDAAQIAGLAAILGHCFPVWLKFKGGKGVATYFGLMIALSPVVGLAAGAIWLVVAAISRYSSLAALMAAGWAPIVVAFITDGQIFALASVLAVLIYVRHAANIGRLRRGEESKIGKK